MHQIPAQTFTNVPELGANEVQIGGHNTNDPRFAIYKGYSGCLSSKFLITVEICFLSFSKKITVVSTLDPKVSFFCVFLIKAIWWSPSI